MRMSPGRGYARLSEPEQWLRCSHHGTALVDDGRGVELGWTDEPEVPPRDGAEPAAPAGLAVDRWEQFYRSDPAGGRILLLPSAPVARSQQESAPGLECAGSLAWPRGIAIDASQRLYVAQLGAQRVQVLDLWARRLLRDVPLPGAEPGGPQHALDVAARGCGALALLGAPPTLVRLSGRADPEPWTRLRAPAGMPQLRPSRVAADDEGTVLVLWSDPRSGAGVVARPDGRPVVAVDGASDLDLDGDGALVVARGVGRPFLVWRLVGEAWVRLEARAAPGYDGGAICRDAQGLVAYTTARGVARASGSAVRYPSSGRLLTYRLDSGEFRTRWGRIFLDACMPRGADLRVGFLSSDDDAVTDPWPRRAPVHGDRAFPRPDLTPPLPSVDAVRRLAETQPLHRRSDGREWAWAQISSHDDFDTFEAPVTAPPGRYLWVVLELAGSQHVTPRVRALRVERPGHRLTSALPRSWTRSEGDADFLQRLLAPAEGILLGLDQRSVERDLLLSPGGTPLEALDWLAGFLGLVLDPRWSVPARRRLVAEAYDLFRLRGTQAALERILAIYLGRDVDIVENWRLRGLAGTVLGPAGARRSAPEVVEPGRAVEPLGEFSVGGRLPGAHDVLGEETDVAHVFTVIMPVPVDAERRAVVGSIVEVHKPAHTQARICELGPGMRVGHSRTALTTFVAVAPGWGPEVVGQTVLGADGVVGVPQVAAPVGQTRVGQVRVG
jgi:phage tail-like protein